MQMILLAVAVGLGVGIVVGALGAGGGILSIPALIYLLHQDPHSAAAGSLLIVMLTGLVALPGRVKRGQVHWKQGLTFGAMSTIGSVAGARASGAVSATLLVTLFAILLAVMGVVMTAQGIAGRRRERAHAASGRTEESTGTPKPWPLVALTALLTGLMTGFFGVGGGFITVPMLTLVLGFGVRAASGTSLVVMIIASLAGLAGRIGTPLDVNWLVVAAFAVASMCGGIIGGPLSQKARPSTLTLIFAGLLFAVSAFTCLETYVL